jgi:hypothetical protein
MIRLGLLARTTGVNFSNALAFVRERFPEGAVAQVVARLGPADRELVENGVQPRGWYDLEAYVRLIRAIDVTLGSGDLTLMPVLGRFEAERDRNFVKDLFLRMASPTWAIRMLTEYWREFHDSGRWTVHREGPRQMFGVLEEFGVADEALCLELTGYVARLMEFAGARNARMVHADCRVSGASACHFSLTWD